MGSIAVVAVGVIFTVFLVAKGFRWWSSWQLSCAIKDMLLIEEFCAPDFAQDATADPRIISTHLDRNGLNRPGGASNLQVVSDENGAPDKRDDSRQKDSSGYASQPIPFDELLNSCLTDARVAKTIFDSSPFPWGTPKARELARRVRKGRRELALRILARYPVETPPEGTASGPR